MFMIDIGSPGFLGFPRGGLVSVHEGLSCCQIGSVLAGNHDVHDWRVNRPTDNEIEPLHNLIIMCVCLEVHLFSHEIRTEWNSDDQMWRGPQILACCNPVSVVIPHSVVIFIDVFNPESIQEIT